MGDSSIDQTAPGLVTLRDVDVFIDLQIWVLAAIWVAILVAQVIAFFDAAMRPRQAFEATGKLTKPAWMGITGLSLVITLLCGQASVMSNGAMFVLAGLVAALVYLTDVRPALREVSGPSRW